MPSGDTNPKVDELISKADKWREEFKKLRAILLGCPLTEEMKWGKPCYSFDGKNVVIIHGFKEYCALLFFKGALLSDPQGILVRQTENVQAGRQIRFKGIREIEEMEPIIKDYILEAIEIENSGLEVEFKKNTEYRIPDELRHKFEVLPALKTAFEALTPGRQRAYLLHFSEPRQSRTREARIEKNVPRILEGKGLND